MFSRLEGLAGLEGSRTILKTTPSPASSSKSTCPGTDVRSSLRMEGRPNSENPRNRTVPRTKGGRACGHVPIMSLFLQHPEKVAASRRGMAHVPIWTVAWKSLLSHRPLVQALHRQQQPRPHPKTPPGTQTRCAGPGPKGGPESSSQDHLLLAAEPWLPVGPVSVGAPQSTVTFLAPQCAGPHS